MSGRDFGSTWWGQAWLDALEGIAGKAGVIRVEDTEAWKREAL